MIFPIPPIYGFSFVAIPIWTPEKIPQNTLAASPCDDTAETSLVPVQTYETQWVFKGYQWHPVAMWYPFVNPGWDHLVDNDPDQMRERELKQEQERHAQQAKVAAKPEPCDPSDLADRFGPPPVR